MQRRDLLGLMGLTALGAPLRPAFARGATHGLLALDATAQAALVRAGHLQPAQLVQASLARVADVNPRLQALVELCPDRARGQWQGPPSPGPFWGVPFAYKDAVDLQGTHRRSGSRLQADAALSSASSPLVARCEASGLIAIGKTATPEFQLSATTEPLLGGPVRNPWNPLHSPGGSSGGAAAAVAAGMLPMAHATDGGGSIRIPASCCGLFGLKPSRSRMQGSGPRDAGVDHAVSRTVRDSATLFWWNQRGDGAAPLPPMPAVHGPSARRLRIGFAPQNLFGEMPDPAVLQEVTRVARLCERLGHQVQPFAHGIDGERFFDAFMVAWSGGAERALQQAEGTGRPPDTLLEPWTLHLARHARALPAGAAARAGAHFAAVGAQVNAWFDAVDVVLSPVAASEPPPLGWLAPTVPGATLWARLMRYASYTPLHNVAGTPAMSVPLGLSARGLPIGSHFAARVGDEQTLFALAYELEQADPWSHRVPPL
ncbi:MULTISPECIES: amidase family protein [unclassified Acidovorax]|uniref:amidase family protein n=1 Tax=unclassified Acidovorax TaxID=2684926 RepID=UPI001C458D42|nr:MULTISPECIES: amidase family protein [unclassified Acidovorax]MBV7429698.1 amidase [Acidovorax sp. sif0732]MBV7448776.1 amidase [Acidovorax sp. sif0715]